MGTADVQAANLSSRGALMLGPSVASGEITPTLIRFGQTTYCRTSTTSAVLAWRFGG